MSSSWLSVVGTESGFSAWLRGPRDIKLLSLQRFVRLFAYGATFLILVQFLRTLGFSEERIGLFMTMTLLGDVVISLMLTTTTDQIGRRIVIGAGAALMVFSGLVFALSSNYWVLLAASVFGVISPGGNEIGPFRAVEESILAQLTDKDHRSDVFAWYSLFGSAGTALGTLSCGWLVELLLTRGGWAEEKAYRTVFILYAAFGFIKFLMVAQLGVEVEPLNLRQEDAAPNETSALLGNSTDSPSLSQQAQNAPATKVSFMQRLRSLLPTISSASYSVLLKLTILFLIDSTASGMASPSWLTYFFTSVHQLDTGALGTLFLIANLLATFSNLFALPFARRFGPLTTMVFTHMISAVFLAMVPLPPNTPRGTWLSMGFLALRASTQSMNQAPRQAFISSAILPSERTAVFGIVNIVKTFSQAAGVGSTGVLVAHNLWVIAISGAGALKALFDILMLWMFLSIQSREEHEEDSREQQERDKINGNAASSSSANEGEVYNS